MIQIYCYCGKEILYDEEDFYRVYKRSWNCASRSVQAKIEGATINISRYILGDAPEGMVWDHLDRNPHNNHKTNLEAKTNAENLQNKNVYKNNRSGHPGVCWITRDEIWRVTVSSGGKKIFIGDFKIFEDAVAARKVAERIYYR